MATLVDIPFRQDDTIYQEVDWQKLNFFFYDDEAQTEPTDFSAGTFQGEVLDKEGGSFLYNLTFNTPANDGNMWPKLTDVETEALSGRTIWYWARFTDSAGIKEPYFYGQLTVSGAFKAGSV
jgi:hypothetical protein